MNESANQQMTGTEGHDVKDRHGNGREEAACEVVMENGTILGTISFRAPAGVAQQLESVVAQLADVAKGLQALRGDVTEMKSSMEELSAVDAILADLREDNRRLTEDFHEREVLRPIFQTLFGLVDRHRQKLGEVEKRRAALDEEDAAARSALRREAEARRADIIELEEALANFGVERYECEGAAFDRERQTCVQRYPAPEPAYHGYVAQRYTPGYRRNGVVVKRETVAVYVAAPKPKGIAR